MWTLLSLDLDRSIVANRVDPDEMAHYEPSHLDIHCLQMCLVWFTGLKWVNEEGVGGG